MKSIKKIVAVIIILELSFLWLLYFLDKDISKYAIYIFNNYGLHEIVSIIPWFSILITGIWMIFTLIKLIREKDRKKYCIYFVSLIILFGIQTSYIQSKSDVIVTSEIAEVISVNDTSDCVVINCKGEEIELNCPELVGHLLEEGKEYFFTYECKESNTIQGDLYTVTLLK